MPPYALDDGAQAVDYGFSRLLLFQPRASFIAYLPPAAGTASPRTHLLLIDITMLYHTHYFITATYFRHLIAYYLPNGHFHISYRATQISISARISQTLLSLTLLR